MDHNIQSLPLHELQPDDIMLIGPRNSGGGKFLLVDFNHAFRALDGYNIVYFLKFEKKIVYIGMTAGLYQRIIAHKNSKIFDEVVILAYGFAFDAVKAERAYISAYLPELNTINKSFYLPFIGGDSFEMSYLLDMHRRKEQWEIKFKLTN